MDFLYQNALLISLVVVSGIALLLQMVGGGAQGVSPQVATQLINREDAQVIDVRDPAEFAAGHLPDARNLPLDKLAERVGEIETLKDKVLIVCCAAGMRSQKAATQLTKQGFAKVHSLSGGVDAWVAAGYPIKKSGRK